MSHELRTPLHSIIGFTNLLIGNKSGNFSDQDVNLLRRILTNAKEQLKLVDAVLDFSKIEAKQMDVEVEPVSIDVIVRDVVEQFEAERRSTDIPIVLCLPPTVAPIHADAQKIKQVLMNIVDNALKFTKRGTVTVELILSPGNKQPIRIDVTDTGVGMPPERLNEIFQPFRQLESGPHHPKGTGLGLSICKSLCDLMGYELQVHSEPGRGSTFSIVFEESSRLPLTA